MAAISERDYVAYPVFKGLQKPLEFMGIQGRYIYWAAAAAGGAIIGFILGYCLLGFVAGLISLVGSLGVGAVLIMVKQRKGLHTKKEYRASSCMPVPNGFEMKETVLLTILCLAMLSCSHKPGKEDALTAHNTVERIKDEWSKVEKPLEIIVTERTKDELEAIGSIGVFLSDNPEETAKEFHFDGESFKPVTPVLADSTVHPVIFYPFQSGLHPSDTIEMKMPMGAVLSGSYESTTQSNEKTHVKMKLRDLTALLRLKLKSDNISDILNGVEVSNPHGVVVTHRKPFNGEWLETRAAQSVRSVLTDCMLNNGRHHDFHLVPDESSSDVTIGLNVNGRFIYVETTLPPLRAGSITELHLSLVKAKLNIGSSWVDTRHPFCDLPEVRTDSIKNLNFLQKDGTISKRTITKASLLSQRQTECMGKLSR